MRIAVLSRQFGAGEPVSQYVEGLAGHLAERGHETCVFAFEDGSEVPGPEGVEVRRVPLHFDADNLYNWSMMLNNELKAAVVEWSSDEIDLVFANDWATVPGGITLSRRLEVPLVVTVHSTENERGFGDETSGMISELEWEAGFEAEKVLAVGEDTRNSLMFDLDVPERKVELIDPFSEGWERRVEKICSDLCEGEKQVAEV
ncbi:MAG: glycosyltransferase family 4 protein [Candidatus Nanohaloarchaea archaeon]